jgi:uncharacterized protein YjiK
MPTYKITIESQDDPFIVESDSEENAINQILLLPGMTGLNGDIEEVS